jgi:antirestriction protein ArdC
MLWGEAIAKGYACPIWMTYRQASELAGQVRKGEHGSLVVYADRIHKTETPTTASSEHEIPFMKGYTVFNCEQIDGAFLRAPFPSPARVRVHRARRAFRRRHRRRNPSWRQYGFLRDRRRPRADARGLQR